MASASIDIRVGGERDWKLCSALYTIRVSLANRVLTDSRWVISARDPALFVHIVESV